MLSVVHNFPTLKTFFEALTAHSEGQTTDLEVVLFGHEFVVSVRTVVADQFVPAPLKGLGVSEAVDTLPYTVDHL